MEALFTGHALDRVYKKERLTLEPEEIIDLFRQDKVIKIRDSRRVGVAEYLFFSYKDQIWFVAIFDEKTREIITILNYRHSRRWAAVGSALLERARSLAEKSTYDSCEEADAVVRVLYIRALIRMKTGEKRSDVFAKVRLESGQTLEEAKRDAALLDAVRSKIAALPPGQSIVALTCQIGKRGPMNAFALMVRNQ